MSLDAAYYAAALDCPLRASALDARGAPASSPPTVILITPDYGTHLGGTAVTITGSNFLAGASVSFNGTAATDVVVVDQNTITCTTPAHATGLADVTVTNSGGGGSDTLEDGFGFWLTETEYTLSSGRLYIAHRISSDTPYPGPPYHSEVASYPGVLQYIGKQGGSTGTDRWRNLLVCGITVPAGIVGAVLRFQQTRQDSGEDVQAIRLHLAAGNAAAAATYWDFSALLASVASGDLVAAPTENTIGLSRSALLAHVGDPLQVLIGTAVEEAGGGAGNCGQARILAANTSAWRLVVYT